MATRRDEATSLVLCPRLAQLVEHSTDTRKVLGSNPRARTQDETFVFVLAKRIILLADDYKIIDA